MALTKKFTCGSSFPSGCIIYTGNLPSFITPDSVDCDASLDDILNKFGSKIDNILANIDLTAIDRKCLDFDHNTITVKGLHQIEINKLCDHETRITDLETVLSSVNIGTQPIVIDLQCLTTAAIPCSTAANTYPLVAVLTSMIAKICSLQAQLDASVGMRGPTGPQGIAGATGPQGPSGPIGPVNTQCCSGSTGDLGLISSFVETGGTTGSIIGVDLNGSFISFVSGDAFPLTSGQSNISTFATGTYDVNVHCANSDPFYTTVRVSGSDGVTQTLPYTGSGIYSFSLVTLDSNTPMEVSLEGGGELTQTIQLNNSCVVGSPFSSYTISGFSPGDVVVVEAAFSGVMEMIGGSFVRADMSISSPDGTSDSVSSACFADASQHGFFITADTTITMVGTSALVILDAVVNNSSESATSVTLSVISINGNPATGITTTGCRGNSSTGGTC